MASYDFSPNDYKFAIILRERGSCSRSAALARLSRAAQPSPPRRHRQPRTARAEPEKIGVRLERRLHQDEVAIAADQIMLRSAVSLSPAAICSRTRWRSSAAKAHSDSSSFSPWQTRQRNSRCRARARASSAGSAKRPGPAARHEPAVASRQQQHRAKAFHSGGRRVGCGLRGSSRGTGPTGSIKPPSAMISRPTR